MKRRIFEEDIVCLGDDKISKLRKLCPQLSVGDFILYRGIQGTLCISCIQKIDKPPLDEILSYDLNELDNYHIRAGNYKFDCRREELIPLFTVSQMLEIIENLGLKWEKKIVKGETKLSVSGDINTSKYDLTLKQKFQQRFQKEYTVTPCLCLVLYKVIEEIIELLK